MAKFSGTLEVLKNDAKMKDGNYDSYQTIFLRDRAEILKIIKAQVKIRNKVD